MPGVQLIISAGKFGPIIMKSLRKTTFLAFGFAAALFSYGTRVAAQNPTPPSDTKPAAAPAQAPSAPPTGQRSIVVNTTDVVVPVTVKDRDGNLVADLKRDEFRVFQDGIEQEIRRLNTEPIPLSLIILIDNDLKART